MSRARVLIYEKSIHRASLLHQIIEQAGFRARSVFYHDEAEHAANESAYDIAIVGFDSFPIPAILEKMKLIISAPEGKYIELGRLAERYGAGCATYPYRSDELISQLRQRLEGGVDAGRQAAATVADPMPEILGSSAATLKMKEIIAIAAPLPSSVLLLGETGTGKELAARALHRLGNRRGEFVAVNCGALPESLLETELFGHEKGAFTGAVKKRDGKFKAADSGTLFLDEVGEMSESLQVKLLRVLESGRFYPVGSETELEVDVRIVCATNRDIFDLAQNGAFRRDLLYRINVISISLPPLRERGEDIELFAAHFLKLYGDRYNKPIKRFSERAMKKMMEHSWPGNIRQLQNCVERAVVHTSGDTADSVDFGGATAAGGATPRKYAGQADASAKEAPPIKRLAEMDFAAMKDEVLAWYEREYLTALLKRSAGSIQRACELSGMDRKTLYRKIKQYGFDKKDFK